MIEIRDSKIVSPITNGQITILFRGKTFRGTTQNDYDNQIAAIHSIEKYVLIPIERRFENCNVIIKICTYENDHNIDLVKILTDYGYTVDLIHIPKTPTGQIYSYRHALKCVDENNEFVLVLRPDLIFKNEIDFSRADKNKILFQWNLFTHYIIKRVPDQYQFIGGNVFDKYKDLVLNKKIDTINPGTLHNLYNFLVDHNWPLTDISFLNYIKNPNPNDPDCAIKGNPSNRLGNPMFNYTIESKTTRRITN
jgi:hypothetical protein